MRSEVPQLEIDLLRKRQSKAREDEVYGGLSRAERAAYDRRQDRIRELERDLAGGEERQRNSSFL
jgi:hypothetical protein